MLEARSFMIKWYKLDILKNVTGPHAASGIRQFAEAGRNFWVAGPEEESWQPVDAVPHLIPVDGAGALHEGKGSHAQYLKRCIDELIGLCKGIVADGRVDPNEVKFLRSWLENNRQVVGLWPANVLAERLAQIYADGVVDEEEQLALAHLLSKLTGVVPGVADAQAMATRLPVDDPAPIVEFEGSSFCLTGRFVFGSKKKCDKVIEELGGSLQGQPTPETSYLVIGALGNPNWRHSAFGEKVEAVLNQREQGGRTRIISEEHWTFFL